MPRTHIKAFTYEPKIQPVRDFEITQTIRIGAKAPVQVGDTILFHGWEGRPYRSGWSWRLRVGVDVVWNIEVYKDGITIDGMFRPWRTLDDLAMLDGIVPPTGEELRRVLIDKNGLEFGDGRPDYYDGQIIRWAKGVSQ